MTDADPTRRARDEAERHWLIFDNERHVTGCHCGFPADPGDDGYGDSIVMHLLTIGAAALSAELAEAKAERDALAARHVALRAECEDQRGARKVAADAADRFRDVLAECLGHDDNNPGDDVLVAEIRARFGKTGPEPTRWRNFLTGALARVDQINAMPDPRALLAGDGETT